MQSNPNDPISGNTVWKEGATVYYKIVAKVDSEEADRLKNIGLVFIDEIFSEKKLRANVLIDVNEADLFSMRARQNWIEFLQNDKINRAAIFGGSVIVRAVAFFVITAARVKNVRYFLNKAEAVKWLEAWR